MPTANSAKNTEYLTKRVLNRATSKGFKEASANAMSVAGSVVIVKNGWVIRKFENGNEERIEQVQKSSTRTLALD